MQAKSQLPKTVAVTFVALVLVQAVTFAAPSTISVQGMLSNGSGNPITGAFPYRIQFYDASTGGNTLGGAIDGSVNVSSEGRFSISITPPSEILVEGGEVWYELFIDTDNNGIDPADVFGSRIKIDSVPYSMRSSTAESVEWSSIAGMPGGFSDGVDDYGSSVSLFNVKDYGANGNGSGDDTAGVQAAINAAKAAGGGIVFLPAGTYPVSSLDLTNISGGITLRGTGINSCWVRPNQSNVHVIDLTGSLFVHLENFQLGQFNLQSAFGVVPKSAIFMSQMEGSLMSNALHFEDLYVSGSYTIATVYCYGVPSSDMINCDFYNYYDGDVPVVWFTHNNEASATSQFQTVRGAGSNCSDWTLTACEIHELSTPAFGQPSSATGLRLSNTHQMRWIGGNISGEGPQLIRMDGHNHHITFVGPTLYSEAGSPPTNLFYVNGTVSGLSVFACFVQAQNAIFAGSGAVLDEVNFQCKASATSAAPYLCNCPGGTLRNSIIHCDGKNLTFGTIEGTNLLINPGTMVPSPNNARALYP